MLTKLLAGIIAGALLIPAGAFGNDDSLAATRLRELKPAGALPLRPIPHLETIQWLGAVASGIGPKVDQSLGSNFDTLTVALDKDGPLTTRYSSMRR